jgi:putative superfamily III holin-X
MAVSKFSRALPDILTDLISQLATLVRKEGQLARAELSENIGHAAAGVGLVVGGAVLLIPALVILLQAGVAALVERNGMSQPAAALTVGGVVLALGVILLLIGMSRLKPERIMPTKTINQLQQDASVARQHVREGHETERAA